MGPGHIVSNTLSNSETESLEYGSDGSVHIVGGTAAAAWLVSEEEDIEMQAVVLIARMTSLLS